MLNIFAVNKFIVYFATKLHYINKRNQINERFNILITLQCNKYTYSATIFHFKFQIFF